MSAYLDALKALGLPPTDPNTAVALGGARHGSTSNTRDDTELRDARLF